MIRQEFFSPVGKPKFWLKEAARVSPEVVAAYSNFAVSLSDEIRRQEREFPLDLVLIGANWRQIILGPSESRRTYTAYKIVSRVSNSVKPEKIETFDSFLNKLNTSIASCELPQRMAQKLAVLDMARLGFPVFDEGKTNILATRKWGRIIRYSSFPQLIYHVASDFYPENFDFFSQPQQERAKSNIGLEAEGVAGERSKTIYWMAQVMQKLRLKDDISPNVLAVGDNWYLVAIADFERYGAGSFFTTASALEKRDHINFPHFYAKFFYQTRRNLLPREVLDHLTILDCSQFAPLFPNKNKVIILEDRPWGKIMKYAGFSTLIYHAIPALL